MKKILRSICTLICVLLITVCLTSTFSTKEKNNSIPIREVQLVDKTNVVDSNFQKFDNYELNLDDGIIDFVGYDTILLSDLYEIDLVSQDNNETILTRYNCSFDYDNGIVDYSTFFEPYVLFM